MCVLCVAFSKRMRSSPCRIFAVKDRRIDCSHHNPCTKVVLLFSVLLLLFIWG